MKHQGSNSSAGPADGPLSGAAEEPPAGMRAALKRFGPLIKHWFLFMVILGVFVALNEWASEWTNRRFSELTAQWMAASLRLLGEDAKVAGITVGCSTCKFTIIGECTAYFPCAIFIAAVLSFPSPILRRLAGVLVGIPTVLIVNQVRLVSLCYLGRAFPDQFETIHIVVWQSLIIFFTVLLWILWVVTFAQRR